MTTVSIEGAKVSVNELVLVDEEAAKFLADMNEAERPEAVCRALKVGLILSRDSVTVAKADFVRAEFSKLKGEIEQFWENEVRNKIDDSLSEFFDPQNGTLPKTLREYLGDDGKLSQLFNEENTAGVTFKLKDLLKNELTGENSSFIKSLDPSDENSPIGRLAKRIESKVQDLRDAVVGEEAAEAVVETGPQKGRPFEELLLPRIEQISKVFGDTVQDVHNQNRAGDFVVDLEPETLPGHRIKMVIDAKDEKLGRPESERILEDSKKNWTAVSSMLVFASSDQPPSAAFSPFGRIAQGYVCVFDKETEDPSILEGGYRFLRLDAVRAYQRQLGVVEPASVGEKIEQAVVKLRELSTAKRRITAVRKSLDELWAFVGSIQADLRDTLTEAWEALGMKKPLPEIEEEPPGEAAAASAAT